MPNEEPYKYATVELLDEKGKKTGVFQDLYMCGAGCLTPRPVPPKPPETRTVMIPIIDEQTEEPVLDGEGNPTYNAVTLELPPRYV